MAFSLDKIAGHGNSTVTITADPNDSNVKKNAHLLVKVGGVVKQSISLVQAAGVGYELFIQTDVTHLPWAGGEIKVTYWVTLNSTITKEIAGISGINQKLDSGIDSEGKHWFIDKVPPGFNSVTYTATYKDLREEITVIGKDKHELRLQIDRAYINEENPTAKITFWLLVNGTDISEGNMALNFVEEGTEVENFCIFGPRTKEPSGKLSQTVTLSRPLKNSEVLTFYLRDLNNGKTSNQVILNLLNKYSSVLTLVDFLTIKPEWSYTDGKQLDSLITVIDSQIKIGTEGKTLNDYFIGNGGAGNMLSDVKKYIDKTGVLSKSNNGSLSVNLKNIKENVSKKNTVNIHLYSNWMDYKGLGNITLNINSYKGTNLSTNNGEYIPEGDTILSGSLQNSVNCHALGLPNFNPNDINYVKQYYSCILKIKFDLTNHLAVIELPNKKSGRSVLAEVRLNGELLKFNGLGSISKSIQVSPNEPNRIYTYTWADGKEIIDNAGVIENKSIKVIRPPRVDSDFIEVVDILKNPGSEDIVGIRFKARTNPSDFRPRFAKMNIDFTSNLQPQGVNQMILEIIQPKLS